MFALCLQDLDATDFNIVTCDTELDGKHKSLAASFNVAPNTIDFSSVWSNFTNLGSNPVVFSVVIGTLCAYAILLVWSTKKDRLDKFKVGIGLVIRELHTSKLLTAKCDITLISFQNA